MPRGSCCPCSELPNPRHFVNGSRACLKVARSLTTFSIAVGAFDGQVIDRYGLHWLIGLRRTPASRANSVRLNAIGLLHAGGRWERRCIPSSDVIIQVGSSSRTSGQGDRISTVAWSRLDGEVVVFSKPVRAQRHILIT